MNLVRGQPGEQVEIVETPVGRQNRLTLHALLPKPGPQHGPPGQPIGPRHYGLQPPEALSEQGVIGRDAHRPFQGAGVHPRIPGQGAHPALADLDANGDAAQRSGLATVGGGESGEAGDSGDGGDPGESGDGGDADGTGLALSALVIGSVTAGGGTGSGGPATSASSADTGAVETRADPNCSVLAGCTGSSGGTSTSSPAWSSAVARCGDCLLYTSPSPRDRS